jgi:TonB-dependent SusC/RagA subfamily outer membrane receptor
MKKLTFILVAISNFIILCAAAQSDATKSVTITTTKVQGGEKANSALIIIDGNKQYTRGTESLKHINPDDIESIEILKDSANTVRYGDEGKAGVILIKTKSGKLSADLNPAPLTGEAKNISIDIKNSIQNGKLKENENVLYILDGTALEKAEIDKIKPADIESVSVLKDASAVKLYGVKAKNGVIVITTKNYVPKKL